MVTVRLSRHSAHWRLIHSPVILKKHPAHIPKCCNPLRHSHGKYTGESELEYFTGIFPDKSTKYRTESTGI